MKPISRTLLLLFLCCLPLSVSAETAYITDRLLLGIYADADDDSQQYRTLPSGTRLDIKERRGLYARVVTEEGLEGWVKYHFLVTDPPAVVRVKALESRLAEAEQSLQPGAAESRDGEFEQLRSDNLALNERILKLQGELQLAEQALNERITLATGAADTVQSTTIDTDSAAPAKGDAGAPDVDNWSMMEAGEDVSVFSLTAMLLDLQWWIGGVLGLGAILGFSLGANWMGRRVRRRFGGVRIW